MTILRLGERTYTTTEIEECGYRHGRDGIMYYPPHRWGLDDHERGNNTDAFDGIYRRGFERGEALRKERHQ